MAKRTPRPPSPTASAQPEPAPGAAMTDPEPAPTIAAAAAPDIAEAPAIVEAPPEASPTTAAVPAAVWPDRSTDSADLRCPWCSAVLPGPDLATCPSCAAQLNGATEGELPGVTTIDVAALAWKGPPPRRNKILSWISGEVDDEPDSVGSPGAVEPPSLAVRREILRLELEAEGISLPHDAEPPAEEEAAAVAEADGSTDPGD
ncbi:MAG: hypothetical protein ACRDGQ_07440 [Candidatus Limnocylindrales bacterium]